MRAGTRDRVVSVAALYALGMTPQPVAHRLRLATSTVEQILTRLRLEWSAVSWRDAAQMECEAMIGERWPT